MSSEISLRRSTAPDDGAVPQAGANAETRGTTEVTVSAEEDETPDSEAPSPQPRNFPNDVSQMFDVGVCFHIACSSSHGHCLNVASFANCSVPVCCR